MLFHLLEDGMLRRFRRTPTAPTTATDPRPGLAGHTITVERLDAATARKIGLSGARDWLRSDWAPGQGPDVSQARPCVRRCASSAGPR